MNTQPSYILIGLLTGSTASFILNSTLVCSRTVQY